MAAAAFLEPEKVVGLLGTCSYELKRVFLFGMVLLLLNSMS